MGGLIGDGKCEKREYRQEGGCTVSSLNSLWTRKAS